MTTATDVNRQAVETWLDEFGRAATEADTASLVDLFCADAHWRDVIALTWTIRTHRGRGEIVEALTERARSASATGFQLAGSSAPPRRVARAGVECVEAILEFETAHGLGKGVLRLVEEDGRPRAWVLLTTLQELHEAPEAIGPRRPDGTNYSRNFGGPNWLDHREEAQRYDDRDPDVLVVGGGQAGLAVAARLGRLDVDTLVVDKHERVGDVWRKRYHALTLHNQVWVTHLPYMPFPETWPVFTPKDKLANWFEAYVDALEINFWTSTTFTSARYDEADGRWDVELRRGDEVRRLRPRHVVMATGVSGIPNVPDIPGLEDFQGEVCHSGEYTEGTRFAGKRAVVFGTGNSGHDVAQDLYASGVDVTIVQRSSITVAEVDTAQAVYDLYLEDLSTEDADLIGTAITYDLLVAGYQQLSAHIREQDGDLLDRLEQVGFRIDWGEDDTGFQMKYLRRGGGYYLNVGCSDLIADRKIGLLQYDDVDRVTSSGVQLDDGTTVDADLIVLATGYKGQQALVRALFGDEVADRVGPVWGFGDGDELRNMWTRTPQPGLWFHAGSLTQSRVYSRFLALQIKACEMGLIETSL